MADAAQPTGPRRLAYVFEPASFDPLALFAAADGLCELVWVADASRDDVAPLVRLLRRLGTLVDTTGADAAGVARLVAAASPDGVLALADDALRRTADLATALGLPFHSPTCALALTDKRRQREALARGGLAVPHSWVLLEGAPGGMDAIIDAVTFPCVLKPRRGEASRDTYRVDSAEEVRAHLASPRAGTPRELVLEEYIPDATTPRAGTGFAGYVSVESIVAAGHVSHLAVTGRMPPAYPFRETGFFIPAELDRGLEVEVLEAATNAARAVGVDVGCLHTEIKLTDAGPVVIEVNGRVGGGVPEMLAAASGTDLLRLALRLALGEPITIDGPLAAGCVAYLFYVHAPEAVSVIGSVEGLDELRAAPGVAEVALRRGPGTAVDWRDGNHGHVASILGTAPDHDALRAMMSLVAGTLRIRGA